MSGNDRRELFGCKTVPHSTSLLALLSSILATAYNGRAFRWGMIAHPGLNTMTHLLNSMNDCSFLRHIPRDMQT